MTIYHVEFAKLGRSLTGGEVCMVELIKYFASQGYKNVVLTTDNGQQTYSSDIPASTTIQYQTIHSFADEQRFGALISYIIRTFRAVHFIRQLTLHADDVVICHSDFFPNTIPSWLINRHNPASRSVNFFHMKAPGIFRGYEGEFTGSYQLPKLAIVHYRLNQWLYRFLTHRRTLIATVNAYYEAYLRRHFPYNPIRVLTHFSGVTPHLSKEVRKQYEVVWIGRFHAQKGVADLLHMMHEVVRKKPDARLLVIGDGPEKEKNDFMTLIDTLGLRRNVTYKGFVSGQAKFELLASARVFAMTSYYESFGIVVLEAMASQVPVIAYDLPVYSVFKDGIIRVPIRDYKTMAERVIALLDDGQLSDMLREQALQVAAEHSWPMTGQELLEAISVSQA